MGIFLSRTRRNDVFCLMTKRLCLRVVGTDAAADVADYLARNRHFHKQFHPRQPRSYFTKEEQKRYIQSDIRAFQRGDRIPFWLSIPENSHLIIGRLSFSSVVYGALSSCMVGYHIDKEMAGKGYMKEALAAGCEYMFSELGLHRIQADIMPHNIPSLRTAKSCGFKPQGLNERYMCIDGKWQDHVCLARLNENDWNL